MSIFTPDFASVESSIPVFDKMRAIIQITGLKPFIKESKDAQGNVKVNAGVQYNLEMFAEKSAADGSLITEDRKGRTVTPFKVYIHTDGGWKFSKPFLMAACGYNPRKEEKEANEKLFQANDWTFKGDPGMNPEQITLGPAWNLPVGRMFEVTLTKKVDKNDDGKEFENQEFGGFLPASV